MDHFSTKAFTKTTTEQALSNLHTVTIISVIVYVLHLHLARKAGSARTDPLYPVFGAGWMMMVGIGPTLPQKQIFTGSASVKSILL